MSGNVLTVLGAGVLGGLLISAISIAGVAALPLTIFALVPTFAVGLSTGFVPALYALAAATAITAAAGGPELAFRYAVAFAAPQAWLIRLALSSRQTSRGVEWYPIGKLLAWLTGIAAALVATAILAFAGREGGLVGVIQEPVEMLMRFMLDGQGWELTDDQIRQRSRVIAAMVPAAMAVLWMLMMVVNGSLAQAVVARGGRSLRPSAKFAELELPAAFVYALGASLVLLLLPGTPGFLGRTLVFVITTAYLILGLAVIHWVARGLAAGRVFLFTVYFLILVLQWLAAVVIVLGLAEQVFGLRKRFFAGKKKQEDE